MSQWLKKKKKTHKASEICVQWAHQGGKEKKRHSMWHDSKPQRIDWSCLGRDFIVFILHTLLYSSCCLVFLIWHVRVRTKPRSKPGGRLKARGSFASLWLAYSNLTKYLRWYWVIDKILMLSRKREMLFLSRSVAVEIAQNILTLYGIVLLFSNAILFFIRR